MGVGDEMRQPPIYVWTRTPRPRQIRFSPRRSPKPRTASAHRANGLVGVQGPLRTKPQASTAHLHSAQRDVGGCPTERLSRGDVRALARGRTSVSSRSACRGKLVPVPLPLTVRGRRALASQPSQPSRVLRAGELTASLLPNAMQVSFPGRHGRMPPSPSLVAQRVPGALREPGSPAADGAHDQWATNGDEASL